ncbi:hypothetical protein PIB30_052578 [Stylosanthes scabra]|uniref:WRKY domain-containing protein n=1 Tax=Stylosanthes scabra TaxID=79078 RepID=A0ABU6ZH29_9FABA|nr:hypothetical protein [Stylosanthes scabra]
MPTTTDTPRRPTITLPPRPSLDTFLSSAGIISPGPITLVSSFFADDYSSLLSPSPSFSQLLAAANNDSSPSALFSVPPGFSPSAFLFSPHPQSPFGISHQQALAQVTAQAVVSQSQGPMQIDYQINVAEEEASNDASDKKVAVAVSDNANKKFQQPSDDGYNWRKYGQKQVKGSEFPRSYYKCTNLSCLVKKKVERACDGHITEIIYKGQHNHEKPLPNKRNNNNNSIDSSDSFGKSFSDCSSMMDHCESYDLGGVDMREEEEGGDDNVIEPNPKRRSIDVGVSEVHKTTVTEPKIIVQTRSEVDLLDDGYKWRKYGQKVVKGNPHPR